MCFRYCDENSEEKSDACEKGKLLDAFYEFSPDDMKTPKGVALIAMARKQTKLELNSMLKEIERTEIAQAREDLKKFRSTKNALVDINFQPDIAVICAHYVL
jgi:hypothetical protein